MKNNKNLALILVFVISFAISFATTLYCRGNYKHSDSDNIGPSPSLGTSTTITNSPSQGGEVVAVKKKDSIPTTTPSQTVIKTVKAQDSPKQETPSKMSASEFERRLKNNNDNNILGGKDKGVAKNVRIQVIGMEEGENIPGDMQEVREKVNFGTWRSFRVVSVGYDSEGRICSAVIQAVY